MLNTNLYPHVLLAFQKVKLVYNKNSSRYKVDIKFYLSSVEYKSFAMIKAIM